MAVDRAIGDREAGAVEPIDDRVAAEHLGRHRRERAQDREFGDRQRHLGARQMRVPASEVEAEQPLPARPRRSEEHTSELQSLMRISYAVFCLKTITTYENRRYIAASQPSEIRRPTDV